MLLAEIPFPQIDPDIFSIGKITVRWYGVSYVVAFALAWVVLRDLAKRKRWPVEPERVADVLFWGILGVFVGGRVGWVLFYAMPHDLLEHWYEVFTVWKGGMSFHGGLLGVIVAYWIYTWRTGKPRGDFFDGLTLATPLGILCVRLGNFINAELWGRPWDGPWAMRFPRYEVFDGPQGWKAAQAAGDPRALWTEPRHPSQLYEGLLEGLLMYFVLRFLMLRMGIGGGRIAATFLVGYGVIRFFLEYVREPDGPLKGMTGIFTRGQQLSLLMVGAGVIVFVVCRIKARRQPGPRGTAAG